MNNSTAFKMILDKVLEEFGRGNSYPVSTEYLNISKIIIITSQHSGQLVYAPVFAVSSSDNSCFSAFGSDPQVDAIVEAVVSD